MSSLNPLSAILSDHKLTGPNFVTWQRNLNIVLTAEEHKYVLTTPCPVVRPNSLESQRTAEAKWKKANEMAKCYIMASISDVLQSEHAEIESAKDIMTSLSKMFADKSWLAKQNALRNIMNARMAKGQSIREHMLKMMDNFNVAEILGQT